MRVRALLDAVRGQPLEASQLVGRATELASALLEETRAHETRGDRARAQLLARLLHDRSGQVFTTLLTDRVYRSRDPGLIVDQARHLLRAQGIPEYLPILGRAQLRMLLHAGPFVPETAARGMQKELRKQTADVVLSADARAVSAHLAARRAEHVRVNLNQLGEAVLGDGEASRRLQSYLELLARPDVQAVSLKLSSISSRVDLLAYEHTRDQELRPKLRQIYRAALEHDKLVSLDMEAYRDLRLTLELFTSLLDEPELLGLRAGIVLQAYLPDSFVLQRELVAWAQRRVARGGAKVRMRLVKGANLAMEQVESSQRGWALPIYDGKREVDANYKRMLEYAMRPEHAHAVELGVASHNLFDVAFALLLRASRGVEKDVGFELLEGMAEPLRRLLGELTGELLVYCPIVDDDSMQTAIAYLMRRLDENTSPENFLRASFGMQVGDAAWNDQRERFERACAAISAISEAPRRDQDRASGVQLAARAPGARFTNEPDTDFSLTPNRAWIEAQLAQWQTRECFDVPFRIAGSASRAGRWTDGFDPSRPRVVPYRHALAGEADLERALSSAQAAARRFATTSVAERIALLHAVAQGLRARRGELIAAMVLDAGKRVDQADTEVSEAIDFAEYYAASYAEHAGDASLKLAPKGVVLVTPPWNFPLAIPAGGVLAALVAGNTVILKPAIETVLVAERLVDVCHAAGVPAEVLQLVLCEDELGSRLITDARVASVVLTGATSTARLFRSLRPGLDLLAETGGKNAIVITALADRDQAIKDALSSAFGHAGQKCSAASLLVCEAEVYDDPSFMRTLEDAARSLPVGSAWDPRAIVTPLIRPPEQALLRGLTQLEPGERWLVAPRVDAENPRSWSPGIKLDVPANGFTHRTELFGPVLGVLRADDLDHALELVNATEYGLTSGLCSLDEREQRRWAERVQAGNLYVNRPITGAIVQRQPFGGWKGSSFGPGAKAGGPSYVLELCRVEDAREADPTVPPQAQAAAFVGFLKRHVVGVDQRRLAAAACRYQHAMQTCFALNHDPSRVLGELNILRYLSASPVIVRIARDGVLGDGLLACTAALTVEAKVVLSVDPAFVDAARWLPSVPMVTFAAEDASACAARVRSAVRLRQVGSLERELAEAAEAAHVLVASGPVLQAGRVELLHYLREQALSVAYHRNGYLEGVRLLPWVVTAPSPA